MKKIFIKKILVVLLLMSFGTIINNGCVQATGEEQINPDLNEILESEEKIMMYDAKTNKTTEVDMEQLRNELSRKKVQRLKLLKTVLDLNHMLLNQKNKIYLDNYLEPIKLS